MQEQTDPQESEEARLRAIHALDLRTDMPDPALTALAALAGQLLGCPASLVTLIDHAHQRIVASVGVEPGECDRSLSFCQHTIRAPELVVVPDATLDSRFSGNPFVTGDMNVRFYAGVPICAPDPLTGEPCRVGAICAVDFVPRTISAEQEAAMRNLAQVAEAILSARVVSGRSLELAELARQQSQALQRSVTAFAQAERIAEIGSWQIGLPDGPLTWSEGVFRICDLPPRAGGVVDLPFALQFYPEGARKLTEDSLHRAATEGRPFDIEVDFRTAAGRLRRARCLGEPVIVDGVTVAVAGVFQDVTGRFELEQSLRRSADLDDLTGLANRAAFNRELEGAVQDVRNRSAPLMLVLADLDHFKPINDEHGHGAGDEVLQIVGERLRDFLGADCTPARIGGDEFALIVRDAAACADPVPFVTALLDRLKQPAITRYGTLPISITVGYGLFDPLRDLTLREFVHRIDSALYDAKRDRRGTARRFVALGRRRTDHEA
jgi:diguanylate cyclase (GGDEF)-like protein